MSGDAPAADPIAEIVAASGLDALTVGAPLVAVERCLQWLRPTVWNCDGLRAQAIRATVIGRLRALKVAGPAALYDAALGQSGGRKRTVVSGFCHNLTELGLARYVVDLHGDEIRYVTDEGVFLVWDPRAKVWRRDGNSAVERLVVRVVTVEIPELAKTLDGDAQAALVEFAQECESRRAIEAVVALVKSDARVVVVLTDLDADPYHLVCTNGLTVDLRNGIARTSEPADLNTRSTAVPWVPGATCDRFHEALVEWFPRDPETIGFVLRLLGYCLSGLNHEAIVTFFEGLGANGKTVLLKTVQAILGDYARTIPSETILDSKYSDGGRPREDILRLNVVRFAVIAELPEGKRLAESLVKSLSGGDTVAARGIHERKTIEFTPRFKAVICTNHRPTITGTDHGIWRRVRIVKFGNVIPDAMQDRTLTTKLRAEAPGILALLVESFLEYQRIGLAPSPAVLAATDDYRRSENVVGRWIEDRCVRDPSAYIAPRKAYTMFREWSEEVGEGGKRMVRQKDFVERLRKLGFAQSRTSVERAWEGFGLRADFPLLAQAEAAAEASATASDEMPADTFGGGS